MFKKFFTFFTLIAAITFCFAALTLKVGAEDYEVQTGVATVKPIYLVESETVGENIIKNGDVTVEDFANENCFWKDAGWAGFDTSRLKITAAWLADPTLDGNVIGFYQDIQVEKNSRYSLSFECLQWNVSGNPDYELSYGFADPEATGVSFIEGQVQKVTVPHSATQTITYVFESGNRETVRLAFTTTYKAPAVANNFGGLFFDNFTMGKLSDGDVLVNGNVAINDFAADGVAWKNAGWAGFDGNRLKITAAWTADPSLDGSLIGFYQDVDVEANTDYVLEFTELQWNLSGNPDYEIQYGFSEVGEGISFIEGQSRKVTVAHGKTETIKAVLNSGEHTKLRLAFQTKYKAPAVEGNFGGQFFSNLSLKKSLEAVKNGDFFVQDFANSDCYWKDGGWAGFDQERGKLTWAWFADPSLNGNKLALKQTLKVEKNTYYYVAFDAMQFNVSGRDNHDLIVSFAAPDAALGTSLEGQQATIKGIGDTRRYYVAFNSGDNETVDLRFETVYEAPVNDNTFGGFFFDNVSVKKIVGLADLSLDVLPIPANGNNNYVYLGETGNTTQINPNITNITDFGLTMDDVTVTYTSENSTDIATVSATGLVTAGKRMGAYTVKVHASIEFNGKTIEGEGTIKIRVINPTSKDVFIDADPDTLPYNVSDTNVLNNGDFESAAMDTSTTDHTLKAETWRSVIGTWMNTEALAGKDRTTGGKITWRWENGFTEGEAPGFYEDVTVKPNTLYQLQFDVYAWTGTKNGHNDLLVGYRDRHAEDIWEPVYEYAIATPDMALQGQGWSKVTLYLYTEDLSEIRLFVYAFAQAGHDGGAGFWFDNFELKEVTSPKGTAEVKEIDFSISNTMRNGQSQEVKTFLVYPFGYRTESDVTPTMTSSDSTIIAIENGKLVAKKEGKATITLSATVGGKTITDEVEVTVLAVPQSLSVKVGSDNTINEGRDQKITVTVTYSNGETEVLTKDITYTVTNSEIIAQKGQTNYLAGKKAGKATLTAKVTIDGFELTANVEVTVVGEENPDTPTTPTQGKKCGGSIVVTSAVLSAMSLLGICLLSFKKRKI